LDGTATKDSEDDNGGAYAAELKMYGNVYFGCVVELVIYISSTRVIRMKQEILIVI
jgi:hypothetical protein